MMVHEFIHSLEANKNEGMFLKMDLSKAYDRVDWSFLGLVLQASGFDQKFVRLYISLFQPLLLLV